MYFIQIQITDNFEFTTKGFVNGPWDIEVAVYGIGDAAMSTLKCGRYVERQGKLEGVLEETGGVERVLTGRVLRCLGQSRQNSDIYTMYIKRRKEK